MALVEIRSLNFTYPGAKKPALTDVDLTIEEGEFVLIAGPSGCGKSTLLRRLKPAISPYGQLSGGVFFGGEAVEALPERRQAAEIGFVMQDPEMQLVTDKVWHELAFGLENLGTDQRTMRIRVAEMANFFGIQDWYDKKVSELSGGQKQLLCLAAVMVMQPRLLLLDEPTSQLDPIAAGEFFDTLERINTELGTTIIVTEHRTEALFPIVDKVVLMREGRIFRCGDPRGCAELYSTAPDFAAVLPTAMEIYAGTGGDAASTAPLTVREGRAYLTARIGGADTAVSDPVLPPEAAAAAKNEKQEPLAEMREVWFRYERDSDDILKGMNLDIFSGELLCIMGGNGAGKTTAIMAASGLYRPYRGKVLLDGKPVAKL
ncbi:MAG: ABC transporter ATP-binding protein, partial [Clostridia bacterium]|nr:ABC transporter ATP-binding protein [Clostridia bacterium]